MGWLIVAGIAVLLTIIFAHALKSQHFTGPAWQQSFTAFCFQPGQATVSRLPQFQHGKGVKSMASFKLDLAEMYAQDAEAVDFLSKLQWVESLGHRVNVNIRHPQDVKWLVDQIAAQKRNGENRTLMIRLTMGAIAATAAIIYGSLGGYSKTSALDASLA